MAKHTRETAIRAMEEGLHANVNVFNPPRVTTSLQRTLQTSSTSYTASTLMAARQEAKIQQLTWSAFLAISTESET